MTITQTLAATFASNLDRITRNNTAFASFDELIQAEGGYRPTVNVAEPDMRFLADSYDLVQHARGDDRRAHRYARGSWNQEPAETLRETIKPTAETREQLEKRRIRILDRKAAAAS